MRLPGLALRQRQLGPQQMEQLPMRQFRLNQSKPMYWFLPWRHPAAERAPLQRQRRWWLRLEQLVGFSRIYPGSGS